ncbi:MAG: hypothetical protein ABF264_00065 [Flavobacteriales bacterium]
MKKNIDQDKNTFQIGFGISSPKRFIGKIKNNSFKANRVLNYRNSFSPIVFGEIQRKNRNSTEIKLNLRIHLLVKVFSIIWFTGFTLGSSLFIFSAISSGQLFPPAYLIVLAPIALFLVFNYFFKKEVKLSKEILMQILEAEEI